MPAHPLAATQQQAAKVVKALQKGYPDAECALLHDSPFQLLIATILSAQCTDERVNIVTKDLFKKWGSPQELAEAPIGQVEKTIQSAGFFRMKAKNIQGCSRQLVEMHCGVVPQTLEELIQLPGVGRKTANVVLGTSFGIPSGIVVDTHVTRLTNRLGLTAQQDAVKIENELIPLVQQKEWINFSHRLIHHGRRICKARKPLCNDCLMLKFCPQVGVEQIGTLASE